MAESSIVSESGKKRKKIAFIDDLMICIRKVTHLSVA